MKRSSLNSKSRSGAALMLALWALFLLSAMVISWALDIDSRLAVAGNASRVLDAEAMESSGAEVALAEAARQSPAPNSPNLHKQLYRGLSHDVHITCEEGRLDLNSLTLNEHPTTPAILQQYL